MIIRSTRNEKFTKVGNDILADDQISFRAKGVLVYLLGKPDHWQVSERQLATVGNDGVTAIRAALKELELAGYIQRRRSQGANGRFEWESVVYDEPQPLCDEPCLENLSMEQSPCLGFPCVEEPCTEEPCVENRAVVNTIRVSTEQVREKKDDDRARDPSAPPPLVSSSSSQPRPDGSLTETPKQQERVRLPAAAVAQTLGNRDPAYLAAKVAYENNIGLLTPILAQRIEEALRNYPPEWVPLAIERAVTAEKRHWNYIEGILRNWSVEGFNSPGSRRSSPRSTKRSQPQFVEEVTDSYADLILQ